MALTQAQVAIARDWKTAVPKPVALLQFERAFNRLTGFSPVDHILDVRRLPAALHVPCSRITHCLGQVVVRFLGVAKGVAHLL